MKRTITVLLALLIVLSLAACGGGGQTTPTQAPTTEPTQAPTAAPTTAPTPDPTPASTPEPTVDYSWISYSYSYETNDGYQIEKYFQFIDTWIDSDDESTIETICSEIGLDYVPTIKDSPDIFDTSDSKPHCMLLFGFISCANTTDGFSITADNAKRITFNHDIGIVPVEGVSISQETIMRKSVLKLLYSDKSTNAFHVNCNRKKKHFENDWYGDTLFSIKLASNRSGILPFVIAVYSPINPKNPQGDKWYCDLKIIVGDDGKDGPLYEFLPNDE